MNLTEADRHFDAGDELVLFGHGAGSADGGATRRSGALDGTTKAAERRVSLGVRKWRDSRRGRIDRLGRQGCLLFGFQDREKRIPMSADSIFRIASMTKPITSVALMSPPWS